MTKILKVAARHQSDNLHNKKKEKEEDREYFFQGYFQILWIIQIKILNHLQNDQKLEISGLETEVTISKVLVNF